MPGGVPPSYYTYDDRRWHTPEVVLAAGPRNVGSTGDGSYTTLHGYAYVGAIVDGVFRLWQLRNASGLPYSLAGDSPVGGGLAEVLELPLPEGARHLALAFDQAAREVIAYEVDGQVYVRQWDPVIQQYTLRGPFSGVDPVLINDATVGYFPPDSDVLLFHLTPDRKTLVMRAQRELYDTPHTIQTFETPVVLDQVIQYPYRIALVGSRCDSPAETGYWLNSHLYPIHVVDGPVVATAAPLDAEYLPGVLRYEQGEATLLLSPAPQSMGYVPAIIAYSLTEQVGATATPRNMLYTPALITYSHPIPERVGATPEPQNMLYAFAAIRYTGGPEGVSVQPQPQSMRYYV